MPKFWWKSKKFENEYTEMLFDVNTNQMKLFLKGPNGMLIDLDGNLYKQFDQGMMTSLPDYDLNFLIDPDKLK